MNQPKNHRSDPRDSDPMLSRCRLLSVPCVRLTPSGVSVASPSGSAPLHAWLSAAPLVALYRQAVEGAGSSQGTEPALVFDGCWLIPLQAWSHPGVQTLAVVITEEALRATPFGDISASAGLDPHAARAVLEEWVQWGARGPQRVAAMLGWTREDTDLAQRQNGLLEEFSNKLIQAYEETHVLFRIMRLMASTGSPRDQVQLVCNQIQQILPFRWVCTLFRDHPRVESRLRGQMILAGETPCAAVEFRTEVEDLLASQKADTWTRVLYPEDSLLAGLVGAEIACDPITHDGAVVGVLLAGNKRTAETAVASPEIQFIDAVADFLGTFHENAVRFAEQQALFMGTLGALSAAIDAKDPYTRGHSERVAFLASQISLAIGQNEEQAERARVGGMVHDIGKIGVPEAILCKPGRLTDDEFEAIKRHPEIGYRILRDIDPLRDVLPGVLHHHERWDGRGYPHGVAGEDIPLIARIIGLADTFDAMSSTRSYRPALPRDHVLKEIERSSGSQFDPRLVEAFRMVELAGYDELLSRQTPAGAAITIAA